MVPVENSIAGRVADIHNLLPSSGLHIIGEHFHRVNHHILAPRGATLDGSPKCIVMRKASPNAAIASGRLD